MSSIHSSAEAAVERQMVAALERCFPDVRKQIKFRQCLSKRKESFKYREGCLQEKRYNKDRIIQENLMRKLILYKELSKLPSSDERTVRVRGSRVGTIRRGTATGVGEFQGGPKFCF